VPGDFHLLVRFLNDRLPKAGYLQNNGQLHPFDAESDFAGKPTRGRWSVGLSPACEGQARPHPAGVADAVLSELSYRRRASATLTAPMPVRMQR